MLFQSPHSLILENSGATLLALGQRHTEIVVSHSGQAQEVDYLGAGWGRNFGNGKRRATWSWSVVFKYSTRAEAMAHEDILPDSFPLGESESLLKTTTDGISTRVSDFVLTGCAARIMNEEPLWVLVTFEAVAGKTEIVTYGEVFGESWDELDYQWGREALPAQIIREKLDIISWNPFVTRWAYPITYYWNAQKELYDVEGSTSQFWIEGDHWRYGIRSGSLAAGAASGVLSADNGVQIGSQELVVTIADRAVTFLVDNSDEPFVSAVPDAVRGTADMTEISSQFIARAVFEVLTGAAASGDYEFANVGAPLEGYDLELDESGSIPVLKVTAQVAGAAGNLISTLVSDSDLVSWSWTTLLGGFDAVNDPSVLSDDGPTVDEGLLGEVNFGTIYKFRLTASGADLVRHPLDSLCWGDSKI